MNEGRGIADCGTRLGQEEKVGEKKYVCKTGTSVSFVRRMVCRGKGTVGVNAESALQI